VNFTMNLLFKAKKNAVRNRHFILSGADFVFVLTLWNA